MPFTTKQIKYYMKHFLHCPHCKYYGITQKSSPKYGGGNLYVDFACPSCKKTWRDEYTLARVIDI